MKTWTPLFSSIINSSVWGESKDVKIMWITLLAIKDKDGFVDSSLPGLARLACLTIEEAEAALKVLESPDPHSSSENDDGRRVKKITNGRWLIINFLKYRDMMREVRDRTEYQRLKQAEYRKKKAASGPTQRERAFEKAMGEGDLEQADKLSEPPVDLGRGLIDRPSGLPPGLD